MPWPTQHFTEASSINFRRSLTFGMGAIATTMKLTLQKRGLGHFRLFSTQGRKLDLAYYQAGDRFLSSPRKEH